MSECREITHIKEGVIDEWELVADPQSQVVNVRGRDQMAFALDGSVFKAYVYAAYEDTSLDQDARNPQLKFQVEEELKGYQQHFVQFFDGSVLNIPGVEHTQPGVFAASFIAQDVAAMVGLKLLWQVRDYKLRSTFVARGRAIEVIRQLIQPWTQSEPFKAELMAQGDTIIVRYRQTPELPFVAGYTMTVKDMRREKITVRKRKVRKIGFVDLRGMTLPAKQLTDGLRRPGDVTVIEPVHDQAIDVPSTSIVTYTNETIGPLTAEQSVTVGTSEGATGIVTPEALFSGNVQRTTIYTSIRLPQEVMVQQRKFVYSPFLVNFSQTDVQYSESTHGPLPVIEQTVNYDFDVTTSTVILTARTTKTTSYDKLTDEIIVTYLITETFDRTSGLFVLTTMNLQQDTEVAPQIVQHVSEDYVPVFTAAGDFSFWGLTSRSSTQSGGHKAGGPGRSAKGLADAGNALSNGLFFPHVGVTRQPIERIETLSEDFDAQPFDFSNPNLTGSDLDFIMSLLRKQNTFTFEYEIMFEGVAMPWLQKGVTIKVQSFFDPTGDVEISLPVLYVTEARTRYDESKVAAEFVTEVRAFAWL
jgi:hypothetical protein